MKIYTEKNYHFRWSQSKHYNSLTGQSTNGQTVKNFAQMAWKSTTHIGAAIISVVDPQQNNMNITIIVVKYRPAITSSFLANVNKVEGK